MALRKDLILRSRRSGRLEERNNADPTEKRDGHLKLTHPLSPRLVIAGDRGSPAGRDFTNAVLIARYQPGKSASPCGKIHRPGSTGNAYDRGGRPRRRCGWVRGRAPGEPRRAICRSASPTGPNGRRPGSPVKKKVPPGTRL